MRLSPAPDAFPNEQVPPYDGADNEQIVAELVADAARRGASSIHIHPGADDLVIRMRIDAVLRETRRLPRSAIGHIKTMARLDPTEQTLPQDGRIDYGQLEIRVSILPGQSGERMVLHILSEKAGDGLDVPGLPPAIERRYRDALAERQGVVLIAGPVGSGKKTTLYAGLRHLNDGSRNILTIENPIANRIDGVGQMAPDREAGLTFANGLQAILRNDPDVAVVGEIGDIQTAETAVQAALQGHLILSTIYADDAIGAIARLRDMKIEPFLLASTLRLVIAQRLVLRLCPDCRAPVQTDAASSALLGFDTGTIVYEARGCASCGEGGYQGRVGVFEAIPIDDTVRRHINNGGDEALIAGHVFRNAPSLGSAARALVIEGETTIAEAVRISRGGSDDAAPG